MSFAFTANSGSVNEAEVLAVAGNEFVYRIASCTGNGRDNHPLLSGELVQQRGLAHVWMANDGDFGFDSRLGNRVFALGSRLLALGKSVVVGRRSFVVGL